MCIVSLIVAFLATTALYHVFAGPHPGALQVAYTKPRITIPIHQQLIPEHPTIMTDITTNSTYEVTQVGKGEMYGKPELRYYWRTILFRKVNQKGDLNSQ